MPRCYNWEEKEDKYTACNFLVDVIMFCLTGGLWSIWIFVREMRRR